MIGWILLGVYILGALVVFWIPAFIGEYLFSDDGESGDAPLEILFPILWPILAPSVGFWKLRKYLVERKQKFEREKRDILR
jgi:hypothetical protein